MTIEITKDNISRFCKRLQKDINKRFDLDIKLSESEEIIAKIFGCKDYHELNGHLSKENELNYTKHIEAEDHEVRTYADGTVSYWKNNQRHRDGDLPAVIYANGTVAYYKNNQLHRDGDLPAVIWSNCVEYWKNNQRHRDGDQPAVIWSNGTVAYYKNDQLHRDGDLPAVIWSSGDVAYYKNNQRHRDGDQPSVISSDGDVEYWKNGVQYEPQNFLKRNHIISDLDKGN